MLRAVHSKTLQMVTVEDFSRHHRDGDFSMCPACQSRLSIYGASSPNVQSRFQHHKDSRCPLKRAEDGDRHFARLLPREWDLQAAQQIKQKFCQMDNLKQAYVVCLALCHRKNLTIKRFCALLDSAKRLNIWAYKGIELWIIPYILLTLEDFMANNIHDKSYNFRFVLIKERDKRLTNAIDDLWLFPNLCKLDKVYCDSGKTMRTFDIPDPIAQKTIEDAPSWINKPNIVASLRKECNAECCFYPLR